MDVKKQPGQVMGHPASREDMDLINRLAKTALTPEQVYTFAVRLCDNEVDRDWERFDTSALTALSRLFVGKSGIFDHNWSAEGQTARIYRTELCREPGLTAAGEPCCYLKGYAYMLRSEKNSDLIQEIEGGIKKEVSIGCSVARSVCSICGQTSCSHQRGQTYDGKLCYFTLQDPADAYEWSFVAVPAQRKAGVVKAFAQAESGGSLRSLLAASPAALAQLEALEKEALMGRSYLAGLRKEVVRLAGLADKSLDLTIFTGIAEKLEERELLELKRCCDQRLEAIYPLKPQLRPQTAVPSAEEDGAFLI